MGPNPFGTRLAGGVAVALAKASIRYWSTVAPTVRRELARWEDRARSIENPELRALALAKLGEEGFNAEAGAMLATLAPRSRRGDVVEAIVALEVLFDYLDGLSERPSSDPLRDGERLFSAYRDAVSVRVGPSGNLQGSSEVPEQPLDDSGYLQSLSAAVSNALARLPGAQAVDTTLRSSAERAIQAQVRMHAASTLGAKQLEQWAHAEVAGTEVQWRELLAGAASSVLAQHALLAAAADPLCTHQRASSIEEAYLSICVVLTLLDGIVDHDRDTRSKDQVADSQLTYTDLFEDADRLADALAGAARRAALEADALGEGSSHTAILAGVIAYYLSHSEARSAYARPIVKRLRAEVGAVITPPLVLMRCWRMIRLMRNCGGSRKA